VLLRVSGMRGDEADAVIGLRVVKPQYVGIEG